MTLQDFTTRETSELMRRILARQSDALAHQLRTVYEALDAAERALEAPHLIDEELTELTGRLNQAFVLTVARIRDDSRQAVDEAHRERDSQRMANDALTATIATLEADVERLRERLDREQADTREALDRAAGTERDLADARESVRAQEDARAAAEAHARSEAELRVSVEEDVRQARSEMQDLRRSLDESLEEVAGLAARLEEVAGEKGRLAIDLSAAQGELQMARAQREAVAAQLKASVARAHMLGRSQTERIGQLQDRLDQARPTAESEQQSTRIGSSDTSPAPAGPIAGDGDQARLASMVDASVRSVEALTRASSIADLLGALAEQLSAEFSRVAVFRVQADRLQGEHQVGFDYTTEVRKIAMPLSVDSLLTRVVGSGEMERLTAADLADDSKGTPFRGKPTAAIALPVVLRGDTVAVVYLDDWNQSALAPGRGSEESSVLFARLVVRHAGVLFIGHAHEMRVVTELREYASRLLEGAEQMYAADADARMSPEAMRSRLDDNLACARQLFAQRASLEGPVAAGLLEEQLAAKIEADPTLPFVRDLAALAVRAREAEARRAAEAC